MTTDHSADPRLQQAMDWLLRTEDTPGDTALLSARDHWIAEDAANARAWRRACRAWNAVSMVPPVHAAQWEGGAWDAPAPAIVTPSSLPRRQGAAPRPMRRRLVLGGALAACLGLVLMLSPLRSMQADHLSGTGEIRRVTLADGTVVHLAPRSAISAHLAPGQRNVTLLEGEAFFEVAPDATRPFIATAAGVAVQVLGTAFDLQLASDQVSVAVQHGQVRLSYAEAEPPFQADLAAGDRVEIARSHGRVPRRDRVAPGDVASWREGPVFVQDATVGQVVEMLRRYHSGWVVLRDERLAARRVTGLYDLRDAGRALRALVSPYGGEVREMTPLLYIVSKPG